MDVRLTFGLEPGVVSVMNNARPVVDFDDEKEIVTISGIKFSYAVFARWTPKPRDKGAVVRLAIRSPNGDAVYEQIDDTTTPVVPEAARGP